jgi:uncharacterized HhH-GPD family protein
VARGGVWLGCRRAAVTRGAPRGMLGGMASLRIAQDEHADEVLSSDPFALLLGMLLDQQFPMERAFAGPAKILDRFGTLAPDRIASADPEEFAALCSTPPAVHRFPGSMAGRIQALAHDVVTTYAGDTRRLWEEAGSGKELLARLTALPGFGRQKAQIFVALLGKQLGVRPPGWQETAGAYAEEGSFRSVADVVDADSLERVRSFKKAVKQAGRAASAAPATSE